MYRFSDLMLFPLPFADFMLFWDALVAEDSVAWRWCVVDYGSRLRRGYMVAFTSLDLGTIDDALQDAWIALLQLIRSGERPFSFERVPPDRPLTLWHRFEAYIRHLTRQYLQSTVRADDSLVLFSEDTVSVLPVPYTRAEPDDRVITLASCVCYL